MYLIVILTSLINIASAANSAVLGGYKNEAIADQSTVGGGYWNTAATIGSWTAGAYSESTELYDVAY